MNVHPISNILRCFIKNFLGRCPLRQLQLFPSIYIPSRSLPISATRRMAGSTNGLHRKYSKDSIRAHQMCTKTDYFNLNREYFSLNREYVMSMWIRYSQYPALLLLDPQRVYLFAYLFVCWSFVWNHISKNLISAQNHDARETIIKSEFLSGNWYSSYSVANVVDSIYYKGRFKVL